VGADMQRGFTLFELMIVVVAAIALPNLICARR
jgi:prepilin-type N-terminal cleavage/methylation domain-containing protein